jgi:hypothetical protein
VLAQGGNELSAHRSAITGNRAFIEVADASNTTYVTACDSFMEREGKVTPEEIVKWLMRCEHSAVVWGL